MKLKLIALVVFICFSSCELKMSTGSAESTRHKTLDTKFHSRVKTTSTTTEPSEQVLENRTIIIVQNPFPKVTPKPPPPPRKHDPEMKYESLRAWASEISQEIIKVEDKVVREAVISEKFKDIEMEERNGAAIVENIAAALEDLLERRARAAENIGREAEKLATAIGTNPPPSDYVFKKSNRLDKLKMNATSDTWELPNNCSEKRPVQVEKLSHFGKGAKVQLDISSVQVAAEVFDCDYRVMPHVYWSEGLLHTFKQNYAQDAMTDFQYFCSAKGFLRHYPAATWNSMFTLKLTDDESEEEESDPADVYDCRLRPWYVAAGGAPRDIVILFDFSGSMVNSSNKVHAEQFVLTLLTALTDDDHVNVLTFNNRYIESVINCFDDILVPANHINTAAMMTMLKVHIIKNETDITKALEVAVDLLNKTQSSRESPYKPKACQQAIILLSDSINENHTLNMSILDPTKHIRLFVIWLHDVQGLRDHSYLYSQQLACSIDGYFSELVTDFDVTEQVMQILRVLERPLVHQRKRRIRAFSDVYAHVEDPRRSDYYWRMKENEEQAYRYRELRRSKKRFLSEQQLYGTYMRHTSLNTHGYYYEGTERDYKLQITVSVPVFDDTRTENITIQLAEEKQRNSTRTYPANRLLGVAGVDIPIEHLKLILPYYQLGAGGSLFIIDHRGNIILHDNLKPVFDGDILRPGYRTVDLLDLEQSAYVLKSRQYLSDWLEFREAVVKQPRGKRLLTAKYIFDSELRAILGEREYHWKRVKDHYTVVAALPTYNRRHAVPKGVFTQQLANSSYNAMVEMAVHPEWLYCKHVDQQFNESDCEVRHFVMRRKDEPDFKMQNLRHIFTHPFSTTLLEKTYICNEELMARLCKEAMATKQWAEEYQNETANRDCTSCELGSVTAFFAGESGLTRWQQYRLTSGKALPPSGDKWPGGPTESWYKRAVAAPGKLIIHAPLTPVRKMRNTDRMPPAFTEREIWLTAARTMTAKHDKGYKGMIGVAGYHFYPEHLEDLLKITTNRPCQETVKECDPRCDGENWACVLMDEGGWIVAGDTRNQEDITPEDPIRLHLANVFPHAMRALLSAKIFELNWIHDYQGICFPPEQETVKAASTISSVMRTLWRSVSVLLHVTKEMLTVIAFIGTGSLVKADTAFEQGKRRNATKKSYERVKFEDLHDDRVIVNRTRFAACDRSRALYVLQPQFLHRLKSPAKDCSWPVVGAEVPGTNLILLAINRLCPDVGRPVNDPFVNVPVDINADVPDWDYKTSSANLACWRNKVHLPIRAPPTTCFPHVYDDEEGYRQCGPWLPNPETSGACRETALQITYTMYWLLLFVIITTLL